MPKFGPAALSHTPAVLEYMEAMGARPPSDAEAGELLERTAAGDAAAFGLFYDCFEAELLRFFPRRRDGPSSRPT